MSSGPDPDPHRAAHHGADPAAHQDAHGECICAAPPVPLASPGRAASLTPLVPPRQTSPTSLTSYCSKYAYWSADWSTTVCAGMDFNWGNDLGWNVYTGSFSAALSSCQSWCFSTYSSAMGGVLVGSEATTSHTCFCKGTWTTTNTASCWYGVGFYKGEWPVMLAWRWRL
jgi:hypothetical protein